MTRLAIALFVCAAAQAQAGGDWEELGDSASSGGINGSPASLCSGAVVAVDGSGRPVVSWLESDDLAHGRVYLRRWDGSQWKELGGSASGDGLCSGGYWAGPGPSLALDGSGNPVVSWIGLQALLPSKLYLKRWNGTAWTGLGGSDLGDGIAGDPSPYAGSPSLALDGAGNPAVAWVENVAGATAVYLRHWDGASWAALGGSAAGNGVGDHPAPAHCDVPVIALDGLGYPAVAWIETAGAVFTTESWIYLRKWNGSAWMELGASASGSGVFGDQSNFFIWGIGLALDSAGNPMVAWPRDQSTLLDLKWVIYLKRWDGTSWIELGQSASGTGVSGNIGTGVVSFSPVLAIDHDDHPVVAWSSYSDTSWEREGAYLRKWDGTVWTELGTSASGDGVSFGLVNPSASSPSIALDAAGNPAVAWTGPDAVYLRQWTVQALPTPTPTPSPSIAPSLGGGGGGSQGGCSAGAMPIGGLFAALALVVALVRR